MMQRAVAILALSLIGVCLTVYFYNKLSRAAKIREMTTSEAEIRKLCASDDIKSRIKCLRPKLDEIAKETFPKKFVLIKDGKRVSLESMEFKGYIRIKRTTEVSFGGQCMSSFYLFDFDGSSIYISKDNVSGIIFCKNSSGDFIIASEEMTEETVKNEVKTLANLSI